MKEESTITGIGKYQELGSRNWKQSDGLDPSTFVVAMNQSLLYTINKTRRLSRVTNEVGNEKHQERKNRQRQLRSLYMCVCIGYLAVGI